MLNEKIVTVYNGEKGIDYTENDYYEYFKFVERPDFKNIREIYLHNNWIEIVQENDKSRIFNDIFGTYAEQ